MATKKQTRKPKIEWLGYLNVNLTVEQDTEFDVWAAKQSIQLSDLDILLNSGYKFSLNWDSFHSGVSASLFANDAKLERAGYTLTAWSTDVESAMLLLFYKHYIICEEQWEHFAAVIEKTGRTRG